MNSAHEFEFVALNWPDSDENKTYVTDSLGV